ncbi:helix-turn-helix domain-containing protein, partial [Xanthocytophaga agilis]
PGNRVILSNRVIGNSFVSLVTTKLSFLTLFFYPFCKLSSSIRGNIKVESIRQKTGVSQRYLDTIFRQWVGITPKEFSSIIKINHFIDYRQQHPEKKLTECSYENQFFDQSHLIRIFKTFTGQSPKNYFHTPHTISTYFAQGY